MEIIGVILLAIFIIPLWLFIRPKEEGTLQERYNNPDLNTNTYDIYNSRLNGFTRSKFKGVMYYQGPRGGRYYYSMNGNKVYV